MNPIIEKKIKAFASFYFVENGKDWSVDEFSNYLRKALKEAYKAGEEAENILAGNVVTRLLTEYANTPLDQRSNGWYWLLRVQSELLQREIDHLKN